MKKAGHDGTRELKWSKETKLVFTKPAKIPFKMANNSETANYHWSVGCDPLVTMSASDGGGVFCSDVHLYATIIKIIKTISLEVRSRFKCMYESVLHNVFLLLLKCTIFPCLLRIKWLGLDHWY